MSLGAGMTSRARRAYKVLPLAVSAFALLFVLAYRRVFSVTQRPSWPPPFDAVTPADAQAATEVFVARGAARPHDAALPFAWSTAATIEPWAEGVNFFPKIFADVEAARSTVHILMFGWREGAPLGLRWRPLGLGQSERRSGAASVAGPIGRTRPVS